MVDEKDNGYKKYFLLGLIVAIVTICLLSIGINMIPPQVNNSSNSGIVIIIPESITLDLKPLSGDGNVSESQMELARDILEARFLAYDPNVYAYTVRDENGTAVVFIDYLNISDDVARSIATTQGVFEMRIQANDSQSLHILNADDILNVSDPGFEQRNGLTMWGVYIRLTDNGSQKLRQVCIDTGAVTDPANHSIILLLDNRAIYEKPLSPSLMNTLAQEPVNYLAVMTGTGNGGHALATKVSASLRLRPMPVRVEIRNNPVIPSFG